ncbi:MAG: VTT domain-containing protein [Caldilinea sp.]|nr:VTT domain-containing protein [Caldilinea sp.]MDW8440179.1 VTT domain-containing protein [Caldilineaceae bacterium]
MQRGGLIRRTTVWLAERRLWLLLLSLTIGGIGAWRVGPWLWSLLQDEVALEAFVARLGVWGPLALIALNAVQIVVAPLPGYVMQVAAGYLFGPIWGGVFGALGVLIGSMTAMALARFLGRPLVERLVGAERLDRWERMTFSTNTAVWFAILLAPTGDLPYFMAGLSQVSFTKIFLLTLAIRAPSSMAVAAAGAGVWWLSGWQLAALLLALGLMTVFFLRHQERLQAFIDRQVQRRLSREESS